jgi:phosphatidylserine decarboxylase
MRPIASPGDNKIVVSPADSVPQGVWSVDEKSNIHVDDGLKVKLIRYFNVNELIGKDSKYKDAFAGGVLTHNFLNVNDYHRYHFAVSGVVKEVSIISQNVSLEVAWNPKTKRYDPIDSTGWQFSQTRGVVIVDTGEQGLVALIPMGMAQVSSVNFEDDVQIGSRHRKGDMLGTFLFGGSDFVIVFQKKAGFVLTTPKELHSSEYKHRLMGQSLGQMGSE